MKKLLTLLLLAVAATQSFAGESTTDYDKGLACVNKFMEKQFSNRWKPGIKLGTQLTSVHTSGAGKIDYNNRLGYEAGLHLMHISRNHNRFVDPGIVFTSMGGRNSATKMRINYIEIPVRLGVNIWTTDKKSCGGRKLHAVITPYGAVAVGGRTKIDGLGSYDLEFGSSDGEIKRFDYGAKASLSLLSGSFMLESGYRLGLNNISGTKGSKAYNRGFFLSTYITFGM